jgi:hypothetical protein
VAGSAVDVGRGVAEVVGRVEDLDEEDLDGPVAPTAAVLVTVAQLTAPLALMAVAQVAAILMAAVLVAMRLVTVAPTAHHLLELVIGNDSETRAAGPVELLHDVLPFLARHIAASANL